MQRSPRIGTAIVAAALVPSLAVQGALSAGLPRVAAGSAERNLLGAVRVLASWHAGITDPRTGVLPANTTARCVGRGRPLHARYSSFTCLIARGRLRVRVLYVVLRNGFELRSHSVIRH